MNDNGLVVCENTFKLKAKLAPENVQQEWRDKMALLREDIEKALPAYMKEDRIRRLKTAELAKITIIG